MECKYYTGEASKALNSLQWDTKLDRCDWDGKEWPVLDFNLGNWDHWSGD